MQGSGEKSSAQIIKSAPKREALLSVSGESCVIAQG